VAPHPIDLTGGAASAVRARQQDWIRGLLGRDVAALQSLLAPELVYVHSTGVCHDRQAYLRFVETGPAFLVVALAETSLQGSADWCVAGGLLSLTLRKPGMSEPQSLTSIVTQVWRRDSGSWQLLRAQATRPAMA